MRSILIVEDHEQMSQWLAEVAHEAFPGARVDSASTLAKARCLVGEEGFALALIDIGLPDGSGIDLVAELVSGPQPDCFPVVTTIYDDDKHLFAALEAGAKGYLLKDQPRDRLLAQLEGISRGEPPLSPSVARRMLSFFQASRPDSPSDPNGDKPALTRRETEVLRLLARGRRRNDIADSLGITANTVAGYVKTIYRKLNISGRAEAAVRAVNLGLIDSDS